MLFTLTRSTWPWCSTEKNRKEIDYNKVCNKAYNEDYNKAYNKVYNEDYTKAVYQDYIKDYNKD